MTTTKKSGTIKTESIIGTAAVRLEAATKSLADAYVQVEKLTKMVEDQTLKSTDLEVKISQLDTDYNNKKAQKELELDLSFRAKEEEYVDRYLAVNGMIKVSNASYLQLRKEYENLKQDYKNEIASETGKIRTEMTKDFDSKMSIKESEFKMKEAENNARISELQGRLDAALQSVDMWRSQLEAERNASVERAKASAIGTVSIAPTK